MLPTVRATTDTFTACDSGVLSGLRLSVRTKAGREQPDCVDEMEPTMVIDCDTCVVRGRACGDCVISVLLGHPAMPMPLRAGDGDPGIGKKLEIDADERRALAVLAEAGMVPRLRLVPKAG